VINVDSAVAAWIEIWNSITHPVWDFILYPLVRFWDVSIPWWFKDYLSVGVIITSALSRSGYFLTKKFPLLVDILKALFPKFLQHWLFFVPMIALYILTWPIMLIGNVAGSIWINWSKENRRLQSIDEGYREFVSLINESDKLALNTLVWFLLMVAFNYMLLFNECGVSRFVDLYSPGC
jgi:branched-subunit amino acid transport protein